MNRKPLPYLIIGLLVIILVGGFFYIRMFIPKHNWTEHLVKKNKEPYGLSIFYDIVKKTTPKDKFHELNTNNFESVFDEHKGASYLFVGTNYFIDSLSATHLIEYVKEGHNACIASSQNLSNFINTLIADTNNNNYINYIDTSQITCEINERQYTFYHQVLKDTVPYGWGYFDTTFFDLLDYDITAHSTIDGGKANFVSLKVGKGQLFLHTNPILFSNYYINQKQYLPYLQATWNTLDNDGIIWDNSSTSVYNKSSFSHLQESPLRFILKHKSFRWAWFILLFGIILFIVFESKRKQKAIPLMAKKENNTLEYAKAISSLYFQSKSHKAIAIEMMTQLYSFIKARYKIKMGKESLKSVPRLAKISGIESTKLEELFKLEIKLLYDQHAESEQLYKLYNLVDNFYKNCN